MKEQIKDYFTFTKSEKNGLLVLATLILLVLIFNNTVHLFVKNEKIDFSEFQKEIADFEASLQPKEEEEYLDRLDKYIVEMYDTLELFSFDPNSATQNQWKLLGLTDKQINTINNYKERGGKFFTKDDFRKIYGIRQKQYEILEPYISLPEYENNTYYNNYTTEIKKELDDDFSFDPNNTTDSVWKLVGLSDKQIKTINNYLSKGGKFYKKDDLLKIYGLKEDLYYSFEKHIVITTENQTDTSVPYDNEIFEVQNIMIELNSATIEDLTKLSAINEYIAKRIIKFRDLIGGFYKIQQLKEVYGLSQDTYDLISNNISVNEKDIKKIRINFIDFKELKSHPYFDYETTKAIINYRTNNGAFTDINQLYNIGTIDEETIDIIINYLTVD